MEKTVRLIDALTAFVGKTTAWLTLVMVLLTAFLVLMRYVFAKNWIAMQELVMYCHATVFMFGIAYTLQRDRHVRVDLFYQRFKPKTKAWIDLAGTVCFLLPFTVFIFCFSWHFVRNSFGRAGKDGWIWNLEGSAQAGGLPAVFWLKSLIILFAGLLFVQGIAELGRNILLLRGHWVREEE